MIKKIFLAVALCGIALSNVACVPGLGVNEAAIIATVKAVKAGVAIAASEVKSAVDGVCANSGTVNAAAQTVKAVAVSQGSGPRTTAFLNNTDKALSVIAATCAQAAANPNDPALKQLLLTGWAAYQSAKQNQVNAASAATNGT